MTNVTDRADAPTSRAGGENATRMVARWAASVTAGSIPVDVQHHGRRLIVDYLAASIAGSTNPLSARLRDFFAQTEPGQRATAIRGARLTAPAAAYVNGTAAHGLELDDGYTPGSVHPGAATIPAILAVAEATDAGIEDAARAVILAVEATARIAAAGHPAVLNTGFHNTGVAGVFGAAIGVVNLLDGTEQNHLDALGLAGSHAGGLREYHTSGNEVKRLHAGKAASDGVRCGELAIAGISGPDTVLEGPQGYFSAFARRDWRPEVLLGGLGEEWVATLTYVKPYPCCRHLHGPIDAALALRAQGEFDADDIESVEIATFELATRFGRAHPASLLEAQLSQPFAVASALRGGLVTLDSFAPDKLADAALQSLSGRVSLTVDPVASQSYPRARPAEVRVTTTDGRVFKHRVEQPLGEPSNPISDEALGEKLLSLATPVIGADAATDILHAAWDGDDIRSITTALGAPRA